MHISQIWTDKRNKHSHMNKLAVILKTPHE
jgi:hypothetical protein